MDKLYDINELLGKRKDESLDEFVQRLIYEGEEDYENGRYKDAEEVFSEWQKKYKI